LTIGDFHFFIEDQPWKKPHELLAHCVNGKVFYVIVGSSGAALTGLQFVVMALIAEMKDQALGERSARSALRR